MGRQGSEFSGRSLLSRNIPVRLFSYVVIMSVHDSVQRADFFVMFKNG